MNTSETPSGKSPAVIAAVIEEHFEELCSTWSMRKSALNSPELDSGHLRECEARIQAHLDGLLLAGDSIADFLRAQLEDDESHSFGSAYVLLCINQQWHQDVFDAFIDAEGDCKVGIRDALCQCPVEVSPELLEAAIRSAGGETAVAAAYVLAFRKKLRANLSRWREFASDEDPAVRATVWKVIALSESTEH